MNGHWVDQTPGNIVPFTTNRLITGQNQKLALFSKFDLFCKN